MKCWMNDENNTYLCCFGFLIVLFWVVGGISILGSLYSDCTREDCLSSHRRCGLWLHVDSTGWRRFSFSSSASFPRTEYGGSEHLLGFLFPFLFISLIFWSNMLLPVTSLEAGKWQYELKQNVLDWRSMTNVSNAGYIYLSPVRDPVRTSRLGFFAGGVSRRVLCLAGDLGSDERFGDVLGGLIEGSGQRKSI